MSTPSPNPREKQSAELTRLGAVVPDGFVATQEGVHENVQRVLSANWEKQKAMGNFKLIEVRAYIPSVNGPWKTTNDGRRWLPIGYDAESHYTYGVFSPEAEDPAVFALNGEDDFDGSGLLPKAGVTGRRCAPSLSAFLKGLKLPKPAKVSATTAELEPVILPDRVELMGVTLHGTGTIALDADLTGSSGFPETHGAVLVSAEAAGRARYVATAQPSEGAPTRTQTAVTGDHLAVLVVRGSRGEGGELRVLDANGAEVARLATYGEGFTVDSLSADATRIAYLLTDTNAWQSQVIVWVKSAGAWSQCEPLKGGSRSFFAFSGDQISWAGQKLCTAVIEGPTLRVVHEVPHESPNDLFVAYSGRNLIINTAGGFVVYRDGVEQQRIQVKIKTADAQLGSLCADDKRIAALATDAKWKKFQLTIYTRDTQGAWVPTVVEAQLTPASLSKPCIPHVALLGDRVALFYRSFPPILATVPI